MLQLQAGYVLDCVKELLQTKLDADSVSDLLMFISYFDIEVNSRVNHTFNPNFDSILSVAHNLISRGLPTRPSLSVEEKLLDGIDFLKRDEMAHDIGTLRYEMNPEKTQIQKIFRAFHLIDPDFKISDDSDWIINTLDKK